MLLAVQDQDDGDNAKTGRADGQQKVLPQQFPKHLLSGKR